MKTKKQKVNLPINVNSITCPKCNFIFIVYSAWAGELVSQIPNSGNSFFCPHCGIDINKAKGSCS